MGEVLFFSKEHHESRWGVPQIELSCIASWHSENWWRPSPGNFGNPGSLENLSPGASGGAGLEVGSTSTTSSALDPCEEGSLVWAAMADGHSCGGRIRWVMQNVHIGDLLASKATVASEYPAVCGACGADGGLSRRL